MKVHSVILFFTVVSRCVDSFEKTKLIINKCDQNNATEHISEIANEWKSTVIFERVNNCEGNLKVETVCPGETAKMSPVEIPKGQKTKKEIKRILSSIVFNCSAIQETVTYRNTTDQIHDEKEPISYLFLYLDGSNEKYPYIFRELWLRLSNRVPQIKVSHNRSSSSALVIYKYPELTLDQYRPRSFDDLERILVAMIDEFSRNSTVKSAASSPSVCALTLFLAAIILVIPVDTFTSFS